jgi:gliding motility-associated lipoprotein GldB
MKKITILLITLFLFACNQKSKIEKEVEKIPVAMKVIRFDQAFFNAKPQDLNTLKNKFPDFFDPNTPDAFWIEKNQNKDWRDLYQETQIKFADFNQNQKQIENVFKHIKYYFPTVKTPQIYTLISEMDYNYTTIYANDKLLIGLEFYLGKDHKFYQSIPAYIRQNFEERQMMPNVVQSFAEKVVSIGNNDTFIAMMVASGKQLYLKDILIPDYTDAEKIGYTDQQILWSKENEAEIWKKFIEDNLLYSTDAKLAPRFINLAPFSKFYLEIDNESPGRIGQWMGWQIVRSFMENNPEVTIQQLLKMDAKVVFEKSKYKPKK